MDKNSTVGSEEIVWRVAVQPGEKSVEKTTFLLEGDMLSVWKSDKHVHRKDSIHVLPSVYKVVHEPTSFAFSEVPQPFSNAFQFQLLPIQQSRPPPKNPATGGVRLAPIPDR
eukprot:GABV01009160.1.p3 GENE.GABV01009160.1~~GABV01009160.1.p3  ORF type:complete len:112 (-),score=33.08 GABV01009160.1:79-414(-)